jgi:hypothetical protein
MASLTCKLNCLIFNMTLRFNPEINNYFQGAMISTLFASAAWPR